MATLEHQNMIFLLAVSLAFVASYLYVGQACWNRLVQHCTTPDLMEIVVGAAGASPWMVFGKWCLIVSWPVWTVVPALVKTMRDMMSPAAWMAYRR